MEGRVFPLMSLKECGNFRGREGVGAIEDAIAAYLRAVVFEFDTMLRS